MVTPRAACPLLGTLLAVAACSGSPAQETRSPDAGRATGADGTVDSGQGPSPGDAGLDGALSDAGSSSPDQGASAGDTDPRPAADQGTIAADTGPAELAPSTNPHVDVCPPVGFWVAVSIQPCPIPCDPGHGHCSQSGEAIDERANPTKCLCEVGWAGDTCSECAPDFPRQGDVCLDPCAAGGQPCSSGSSCDLELAPPACVCRRGIAGPSCDRCAPGYEQGECEGEGPGPCLNCQLTCGGACRPEQVCPDDGVPACRCASSYETAADGSCSWRSPLDNPSFDDGCAHWQARVYLGNGYPVLAQVEDGIAHLRVKKVCSGAALDTEIRLPAATTLPSPALTFRARGNPGGWLGVRLVDPTHGGPMSRPLMMPTATGTGHTTRVSLCLPPARPMVARLVLEVNAFGACGDPAVHDFYVDDLRVESDPACRQGLNLGP